MKLIIFVILVILVAGCGEIQSRLSKSCYADNPDMQKFLDELDKFEIKYTREKDMFCVASEGVNQDVLNELDRKFFGSDIPEERNIVWPPEMWVYANGEKIKVNEADRILKRLEKENIEVNFLRVSGEDVMVWSEKDHQCVNKILENKDCE